jgi:hypothetical protein
MRDRLITCVRRSAHLADYMFRVLITHLPNDCRQFGLCLFSQFNQGQTNSRRYDTEQTKAYLSGTGLVSRNSADVAACPIRRRPPHKGAPCAGAAFLMGGPHDRYRTGVCRQCSVRTCAAPSSAGPQRRARRHSQPRVGCSIRRRHGDWHRGEMVSVRVEQADE